MAAFTSVPWTTGDIITEVKLDNMVSNSQSEDAHAANGMIMNNNVAYKAKNAAGTTKNILNKNTSDQTTIGENNVRATRFVPVSEPISLLSTNPANTNWVDLDVTANTSALCYAVAISVRMRSTGTRAVFLRKNGDSTAQGALTEVCNNPVANIDGTSNPVVEVDSGQIFEWSVNNADVTSLIIVLRGYWENVD